VGKEQFCKEICSFNQEFKKSANKKRPIVCITPEIGKWSTIGGLGKMIDMLMRGMAEKYLKNIEKTEIYVISLSYEFMATPTELEEETFKLETFTLPQGQNIHSYSKKIDKITYVFLNCNNGVFIKPYIYKSTPNMTYDDPLIFFPYCTHSTLFEASPNRSFSHNFQRLRHHSHCTFDEERTIFPTT